MIHYSLLIVALSMCVGALTMTLVNLRFFRRTGPDARPQGTKTTVAVCIPARNEETNIEECVRCVLAQDAPGVAVYVYDDQSADRTPEILVRLAEQDASVRLVPMRPLPPGWVGKQWACWQLGQHAHEDWLLFIDADVRLATDAVRRALAAAEELQAPMVSTFPRQVTRGLGESLLIPLIHFILLSYLPFGRMRRSLDPASSAACGQFILARRDAYLTVGGHGACRDSMHDGVKLPRAFRRSGFKSDLFDGTDVASCRMYRGLSATWRGFAKNAYEGLGSPVLLVFITALHLIGHVLPWVVLAQCVITGRVPSIHFGLALACVLVALGQRLVIAHRFQQSLVSALLHPLGVLAMTLVQWHSFLLHVSGRRDWRGRALSVAAAPTVSAL